MLDLQLAVYSALHFSSDCMSVIILDLLAVLVPRDVGRRDAVASHLERAVVVVLHRLLDKGLRENWLAS